MNNKITRRQFLKILTITAAGGGLILAKLRNTKVLKSLAQGLANETAYLPIVITEKQGDLAPEPTATSTSTPTPTVTASAQPTATNPPGPPPTGSRVVHVHNSNVTNWNGSSTDYWNYVNQERVNSMVDEGLKQLTGTSTVTDAWLSLLPNYANGERIAIKVNFNNSDSCDESDEQIDAIIHPVNAVIRGLKQIGVAEADICVYDASRRIPNHFVNACEFSDILFVAQGCQTREGFTSDDPSAKIEFNVPPGVPLPPDNQVTDTLVKATYVINIPIMKRHGYNGVTLSFKNHFGSIKSPKDLHSYIDKTHPYGYYHPDYNPLIDIYRNPHILNKTILNIGDGIFANWRNNLSAPPLWTTFNNQTPKSLFFSTDPVAIDCVMCDFLDIEYSVHDWTNDHLILASNYGLGVFERGDPWGNGYNQIDYIRIDQT